MRLIVFLDLDCPHCGQKLPNSATIDRDSFFGEQELKPGERVSMEHWDDLTARLFLNPTLYELVTLQCSSCQAVVDLKLLFRDGVYESATLVRWHRQAVDPFQPVPRESRWCGFYGRSERALQAALRQMDPNTQLLFVEIVPEPGLIEQFTAELDWLIDHYAPDWVWTDVPALVERAAEPDLIRLVPEGGERDL